MFRGRSTSCGHRGDWLLFAGHCIEWGAHSQDSEESGTPVEFTQGEMLLGNEKALVIDVPGVYGLETACKAEEIAVKMLEEADVRSTWSIRPILERNLHLTLHLAL